MALITTVTVGLNARPLVPAPVAGAPAVVVTVVNLDTALTVNVGSSATQLAFPLGPGASLTLNAPVWAGAATDPLKVGVIPGSASDSLGTPVIQAAEGSASGSEVANVYTFPAAGRIWGVMLSHVLVTDSSYAGGAVITACEVLAGAVVLADCRNAIGGASASSVSNQTIPFPGNPVPAGTVVTIDTENGLPADADQAATVVVYYSIP